MSCATQTSKPSCGCGKGAGVGGVAQFVLGFLSTLLLVCLLGGADLRTIPQARWKGIE